MKIVNKKVKRSQTLYKVKSQGEPSEWKRADELNAALVQVFEAKWEKKLAKKRARESGTDEAPRPAKAARATAEASSTAAESDPTDAPPPSAHQRAAEAPDAPAPEPAANLAEYDENEALKRALLESAAEARQARTDRQRRRAGNDDGALAAAADPDPASAPAPRAAVSPFGDDVSRVLGGAIPRFTTVAGGAMAQAGAGQEREDEDEDVAKGVDAAPGASPSGLWLVLARRAHGVCDRAAGEEAERRT